MGQLETLCENLTLFCSRLGRGSPIFIGERTFFEKRKVAEKSEVDTINIQNTFYAKRIVLVMFLKRETVTLKV
jgi:hypothetical protein